jgi:hypothetical protein
MDAMTTREKTIINTRFDFILYSFMVCCALSMDRKRMEHLCCAPPSL